MEAEEALKFIDRLEKADDTLVDKLEHYKEVIRLEGSYGLQVASAVVLRLELIEDTTKAFEKNRVLTNESLIRLRDRLLSSDCNLKDIEYASFIFDLRRSAAEEVNELLDELSFVAPTDVEVKRFLYGSNGYYASKFIEEEIDGSNRRFMRESCTYR